MVVNARSSASRARRSLTAAPRAGTGDMVWLEGGTFTMGSDLHYSEEAPSCEVTVSGFWIDRELVTNTMFAQFVDSTGYVTLAERAPPEAESTQSAPVAPGSMVFRPPPGPVDLEDPLNWWHYVAGASWRHPGGPDTSLAGLEQHPVVHVAYEDADAYSRWAGKRLPTEAEWEFAARGGLEGAEYEWGDELNPDGRFMANTWQGEFPWLNTAEDGYAGTSPVGAFPANGYGLHDMTGNVWEWTMNWFWEPGKLQRTCCRLHHPRTEHGLRIYGPCMPHVQIPRKVVKGGSFLCAVNYCRRYRPAARTPQPIDTSTSHVGFRCVFP